MAEKIGIENLKAVLVFGVTIGKNISDDLTDKKFTFTEILGLIPQLAQIPDLVAKKDQIIAEAKDLTLDEVKELVAVVEGVITNEEVVATIEDGIAVAVAVKNLIERFSKKKAAAPEVANDGTKKD